MATTTNYGFEIPDDTDLVKDGALAMRDLGQDVDTTLATALNANDYAGLVLVKKQTIGTGVSSVEVTGAFSAAYENYKIIINGGAGSQSASLHLQLGSTVTNYKFAQGYMTYAGSAPTSYSSSTGQTKFLDLGNMSTATLNLSVELQSPFLAKQTSMTSNSPQTNSFMVFGGGSQESTTSFTAFTISTGAGTMTGGTIYVYGYGAS
jgi:hypothetical protein